MATDDPKPLRKKRAGPGRPSKFTDDVLARLYAAIRLGATYEHACMAAGVSYDVFNGWRKGKGFPAGTTPEQKADFYEKLTKAEGEMVTINLTTIETAAQAGNWQAAAWKLERRHPKIYGRQVHEHTGPDGSALTVVIRGRDPEPEPVELDDDDQDDDDDDGDSD